MISSTATFQNGRWHNETVDRNLGELEAAIAVDSSGNPHIGYLNDTHEGSLKYATLQNGQWHAETVDAPAVGEWPSIAVDKSDNPHISYYEWQYDGSLSTASLRNGQWHIETVDSHWEQIAGVGGGTSLAIDSSGNPHICYCVKYLLKYATFQNGRWYTETVDSGSKNSFSAMCSMALDRSDKPHISYYDFDNGILKYASFA